MLSASAETRPTSLRARKKAQQKTALLRAAAQLFRQKGYADTRMEDIAVLTEVATKTVYNYFPTKELILIGLLNRLIPETQKAQHMGRPDGRILTLF